MKLNVGPMTRKRLRHLQKRGRIPRNLTVDQRRRLLEGEPPAPALPELHTDYSDYIDHGPALEQARMEDWEMWAFQHFPVLTRAQTTDYHEVDDGIDGERWEFHWLWGEEDEEVLWGEE